MADAGKENGSVVLPRQSYRANGAMRASVRETYPCSHPNQFEFVKIKDRLIGKCVQSRKRMEAKGWELVYAAVQCPCAYTREPLKKTLKV